MIETVKKDGREESGMKENSKEKRTREGMQTMQMSNKAINNSSKNLSIQYTTQVNLSSFDRFSEL